MTKDVAHYSGTWTKAQNALETIVETPSAHTYSFYIGPGYDGAYDSNKHGFYKRINELITISEKAKQLINEKDIDGVVTYNYHDDRASAQSLQERLEILEQYADNVSQYLKEKIDRPFYEAMDKIADRLEALSIGHYTTKNTVAFKRTEPVFDGFGHPTEFIDVTPETISIADLYRVESPYQTTLQTSYNQYKTSDAYTEHQLSQDDYVLAMHHTRAFYYESLDDQRSHSEFWRDLSLGAGVVILTIFCPPAGAVAGVALASADMYSAATGKDWGTGRELDTTERSLRAGFALFDIVPGVGYVNDLAKSGSKLAAKEFLQTSIQKGFIQGAKNLDSFKSLVHNIGQFGDKLLRNVDNYAKQIDTILAHKVASAADTLAGKLRHIDGALSEAAQNFRLNIGMEPQLASGALPPSDAGKLSQAADNLHAFAKNLDGSVDEMVGAGVKAGDDSFTWKLKGEKQIITNVDVIEVEYVKRPREIFRKLRQEFDSNARSTFLRKLAMDIESLGKASLLDDDIITNLNRGLVPEGYQVHHKLPLDDGGTNDFDNLVLIKNEPYHKVVTNYQNHVARGMKVGESKVINWPIIRGNIYPVE